MAEVVVLAMGCRELPYLRWAAATAPEPLRERIDAHVADLDAGRVLSADDLDTPELAGADYARYLASEDAVTSVLAAQVLCLRATHVGSRLTGQTARGVARSLAVGMAMHRERSAQWGHVHS
ncbi:hypothetical protein [Actinomycetospora sp. CA-084318]|uniref:hypothetical protein n=1 Tax=Actinomycetospora sp. CA-084318 TaxID=3239892 RepID=UPI003D98C280